MSLNLTVYFENLSNHVDFLGEKVLTCLETILHEQRRQKKQIDTIENILRKLVPEIANDIEETLPNEFRIPARFLDELKCIEVQLLNQDIFKILVSLLLVYLN